MGAKALDQLDRWRGWILCAGLVLSAAVFSFRLTSFLHAKEAVVAVMAVLLSAVALVREWIQSRSPETASGRDTVAEGIRWESFGAFLPLWLTVAYCLGVHYLARQAAVPEFAIREFARVVVLLLVVSLTWDLSQTALWRRRIVDALAVSATVVAALGLVQWVDLAPALFPRFEGAAQRMYSVFGNRDLLGGYLAMAIPVVLDRCIHPEGKRGVAWFMLLVCVAALTLSGCRSAWLACGAGILVLVWQTRGAAAGSGSARPRWILAGALALVVMAGAVVVSPASTIDRIRHTLTDDDSGGRLRLWFWDGGLRMARAHALVGVGPGNYAYWSPRYQGAALWASEPGHYAFNEVHTLHAHCDPLELLAETGLAGVVLLGWMLARVLRCRGPEWGGLAALLVFSCFNFPYYSSPHALAGLILAGVLMGRAGTKARRPVRPEGRRLALAACLCAALLTTYVCAGVVMPSYRLRRATDKHVAQGAEVALDAYEEAAGNRVTFPEAHERYGIALFELGRFAEARGAYEKALEAMDTGAIHLALGALDVRLGDNASARKRLRACVMRWPANADAWTLLVRTSEPEKKAAVAEEARPWVAEDVYVRLKQEADMPRAEGAPE